jgi:pimeloyl-ACP methyl ester carboxylesterase
MGSKVTAPLPLREDVIRLADGRQLGWAEYGDPRGRPVLYFHGTPGARRQVPPDAGPAAAACGLRLISVERPGAGWSTPHLYGALRDWADDVAEFTRRLGIERFACVGLSGGGPYALACAHELRRSIPVVAVLGCLGPTVGREAAPGYTRALAYLGPLLRAVAGPASWSLARLLTRLAAVAPHAGEFYVRYACPASDRPVLEDPRVLEVLVDALVKGVEGDFRAPFYDLVLFSHHWGFEVSNIKVPVRFWHGQADGIVPTSHSAHQALLIKDSKVVYKPGMGHFAGYTEMSVVLKALLAVWQEDRAPLQAHLSLEIGSAP